jgi:hypothetical protein
MARGFSPQRRGGAKKCKILNPVLKPKRNFGEPLSRLETRRVKRDCLFFAAFAYAQFWFTYQLLPLRDARCAALAF